MLGRAANGPIVWPDGKQFAFTVFDDTDDATIRNVSPVYSFLADHGFRTTKSVWPLSGPETPAQGATCEDEEYLAWVLGLQRQGFEIGYHLATASTSPRERTAAGLEKFKACFGSMPKTFANHYGCLENIYWGRERLSGYRRKIYDMFSPGSPSHGHIEGDPLFWGDLCRANIAYVRNFVFADIDSLKACPMMPYHDPQRPYVNYWFASSEGAHVQSFNRCINEAAIDRLEAAGSACIMYTHFAAGFCNDGRLDPRCASLMERLSRKNGWFVPVSTLLDYLREWNGGAVINDQQRASLERRWLLDKVFIGQS